jgi:hypothetical protein
MADLLLEEDRIVALAAPGQFGPGRVREVWREQEPLAGALGLVIDLADFGTG